MVTYTFFVALFVFGFTNLIKSLLNLTMAAKLLAALILSLAGAALVGGHFELDLYPSLIVGGAAFGLSTLLHAGHKAMNAIGDDLKTRVISRRRT